MTSAQSKVLKEKLAELDKAWAELAKTKEAYDKAHKAAALAIGSVSAAVDMVLSMGAK